MSRIDLRSASLCFDPEFLAFDAASTAFDELDAEIRWEQHHVRLFGRDVPAPRMSCWIGDSDASYTYSRIRFEPRPWPSSVLRVKQLVEATVSARFNSVLANRYRNGADGMGWHADDEPELGPQPIIASLSLGSSRRFLLRNRNLPRNRLALLLTHGSLLVMRGDTQTHYQHAVPRTAKPCGARINLTFRQIQTPAAATAS
ncbi:MAG: alpha-ketoglutarate-dependent dioxygenase AlkB family protein [Pseudomarimonas sp.]